MVDRNDNSQTAMGNEMQQTIRTAITLLAFALTALVPPAVASELTILSGGAAKAGLSDAVPLYEKASGSKATVEYLPMGPLLKALSEGRAPDIVVVTEDVLPDVRAKGFIMAGSETEIGRVGIGVCVHETAKAPDISTPESLKATLLAAKSIVYIDPKIGTSGRHLAEVFRKLGILEVIDAKTKLGTGGYITEPVGRGEIEIGLHQISEILPVQGVKLVGPLPPELQKVTVYVGAISAQAKDPEGARKFLAHMRTPEVRAAFASRGFMP